MNPPKFMRNPRFLRPYVLVLAGAFFGIAGVCIHQGIDTMKIFDRIPKK